MQHVDRKSPAPTNDPSPGADAIAEFVSLSAEQLQSAMVEAAAGTESLVAASLQVGQAAQALQGDASKLDASALGDGLGALVSSANNVGMQLQSLDRFYQRLCHVQEQLQSLSQLLCVVQGDEDDCKWSEFLEQVRKRYTTEAERQVFDTVYASDADSNDQTARHDGATETVIF